MIEEKIISWRIDKKKMERSFNMASKKIKGLISEANRIIRKSALQRIKTDNKLKLLMKDISDHFRRKDSWPLNYFAYQEMSGVNHIFFQQILFAKNYKIVFNDGCLLIKK